MEQIQDHPIQDIWRVQCGLLVVVNKYESLGSWLSGSPKTKTIRGCKNLKELKEDHTETYTRKTYPKGTLLLGSTPVKAITDIRRFKVEVKASGGTIEGGLGDIQDVMNDIDIILAKYLFKED